MSLNTIPLKKTICSELPVLHRERDIRFIETEPIEILRFSASGREYYVKLPSSSCYLGGEIFFKDGTLRSTYLERQATVEESEKLISQLETQPNRNSSIRPSITSDIALSLNIDNRVVVTDESDCDLERSEELISEDEGNNELEPLNTLLSEKNSDCLLESSNGLTSKKESDCVLEPSEVLIASQKSDAATSKPRTEKRVKFAEGARGTVIKEIVHTCDHDRESLCGDSCMSLSLFWSVVTKKMEPSISFKSKRYEARFLRSPKDRVLEEKTKTSWFGKYSTYSDFEKQHIETEWRKYNKVDAESVLVLRPVAFISFSFWKGCQFETQRCSNTGVLPVAVTKKWQPFQKPKGWLVKRPSVCVRLV